MASNKFNYYDGNGKLNDSITDISNYQNTHSLNGALYFDMDRKTIFANPDRTGIKEFGGTVQPIAEKQYTHKCAANNEAQGYIYFLNVHPTSNDWATPWQVHYTLTINCNTSEDANAKYCHGEYDVYMGCSGSNYYYHIFNKFYSGSYYPIYYHKLMYHNTEAKYNNRATYPAKCGVRVYSAWGPNTRTRTYTIKVYDTLNCTTSFPDNIEIHGNGGSIPGVYSSTYYNVVDFNATSTGLQESSDSNDTSSIYLSYTQLTAGSGGIMNRSLIMEDSTGKWQSFTTNSGTGTSKTANTSAKFRLGSHIYYCSKSTDTAANAQISTSQILTHIAALDFRYTINTTSSNTAGQNVGLTRYKPLYIIGTIDSDGYFRLPTTGNWWSQDEPTTDDGKVYIKVCEAIRNGNTSNENGQYQGDLVSDGTPWYYKKGKFQVYYGSGGGGSALQNMTYNSGIKIGEYLDDDEVSHNIYIPEPIVSTQYSTGINIASYKTSSGTSQIKIPEISTMPAYASGISIAYYPNAASGNTYIHIPIQRVTSMPSTPNTNMIYIVSEMSNGTTNPDEPGTGLDDYVTLSQVYEYVSNNYVSFTTLNTRLNDSSYITSTVLNNLLDDFIVQEQLDESAYITQDYLNAAGYLTSHQSLANYATKSELQTEINNLVNGAPAVLDTLGEIATALSNNQSVSTAITTQIANVKTDLNSYAKTVTLNGTTKSITTGTNDINIGTVITSKTKHKLNATNGPATSTSGTITFVESISGTTTATDGDLSVSTTRKTVTIPSAPVQSDWSISNTNDLSYIKNKPTIPAAQVQSNWNETSTSSKAYILNKPTIPAEQVQSNWNETSTSSKSYIQNKPTIGNATITIQKGGTQVDTFTTNATSNKTINIPNELPSYSSSDSGKVLSINSSGQLVWITPVSIYTGTSEPTNSVGNNGDIYIQN